MARKPKYRGLPNEEIARRAREEWNKAREKAIEEYARRIREASASDYEAGLLDWLETIRAPGVGDIIASAYGKVKNIHTLRKLKKYQPELYELLRAML